MTLGYWGFAAYFEGSDVEKGPLDILYLDWQLFTLESGAVDGAVPWQLQIARILAPFVAAWAVVRVLAALLRNQLQLLRMSFMRRHVVVCGLGRTGLHLVENCIAAGERVVAIEPDENSRGIQAAKDAGANVLCADGAAVSSLRKANARYARAVVAVTGDDGLNVQIALNAYSLFADGAPRTSGNTFTCYVQTMEYALTTLFKEHPIFVTENDDFEIVVFNVYENVARRLWKTHPLDRVSLEASDPRRVHLVLIGFGQTGESVLIQAAKIAHFANGRKLAVTIIDRDVGRREKALRVRYPQIDTVVDLSFVQGEMSEPETIKLLSNIANDSEQICSIALCLDQDSVNVQFALNLDRALAETDCPFYVRLGHDSGLVPLMDHASDKRAVHAFGMISQACDWTHLENASVDTLARAIHDAYLAKTGESSQPDDPSRLPWAKLAPSLRDSNRQQADHLEVKLRALGYGVRETSGSEPVSLALTDEAVETLAQMEHARWNAERALAGWTLGKKDVERKNTPYLVPYDELSEEIKEYDRESVRNLPKLLTLAHQEVYELG